jgi:HAD superfamily hydrolase (TIGR01509 family)
MVKAIIFDFYGVIRSDEYHDWLKKHGFESSMARKKAIDMNKGLMTIDDFFQYLSKISGIPAPDIQNEFQSKASLNAQLLTLIIKLRSSYKIAILSNASSSYLYDVLKKTAIDILFDEVIVSSEVGYIKPSEQIFNYALEKLSIKADEAVFIDDNQKFVEAAKDLGLKGIHYKNINSLMKSLEAIGIMDK